MGINRSTRDTRATAAQSSYDQEGIIYTKNAWIPCN